MQTATLPSSSGVATVRPYRRVTRALVRWVVSPLVTILVTTFLIYTALALAPGDPVAQILGGRSTAEQRAALTEQLGLDEPLLVRYGQWLTDALHGDFGISFSYRIDVADVIGARIGTTALLVLMSAILILVVGIAIGSGAGASRRLRPAFSAVIGFGIAIPGFVAALVLVSVFAVQLRWFPTFGSGQGLLDQLWHLTLPSIALAISWSAYISQITASAVREEAQKDHVKTAIGRGLPTMMIYRKHILRNAAAPVLTASGITIAGLVAGSIVVESAFAIDGLGSVLARGVAGKDYALVTAISAIIVAAFVVTTTLVEAIQELMNPQSRAKGRR